MNKFVHSHKFSCLWFFQRQKKLHHHKTFKSLSIFLSSKLQNFSMFNPLILNASTSWWWLVELTFDKFHAQRHETNQKYLFQQLTESKVRQTSRSVNRKKTFIAIIWLESKESKGRSCHHGWMIFFKFSSSAHLLSILLSAWVHSKEFTVFYLFIHEAVHLLKERQGNWFFCKSHRRPMSFQ